MQPQMRPDDMIMLTELETLWKGYPENMPLQEKFKRLIYAAKRNWIVIYQQQQMANTVMALGAVYKEESEEKFLAYTYLTGILIRTQEYVNELLHLDEEEAIERSEIMAKYHDPKDPEKQLMPLNWNDLWLKSIVLEEKKNSS